MDTAIPVKVSKFYNYRSADILSACFKIILAAENLPIRSHAIADKMSAFLFVICDHYRAAEAIAPRDTFPPERTPPADVGRAANDGDAKDRFAAGAARDRVTGAGAAGRAKLR